MVQQSFEIPPELRSLAEKSVDEARKAFEGFIDAAQTARGSLEGATNKLPGFKAVNFAEENMRAAFQHAEKLVRAKDAEEFFSLQFEFARNQMALYQQQIKELGNAMQNFAKHGK